MNPNYQSQTGANGQTNPVSSQNLEKPFVPKSHNYFPDMSFGHYKTFAYGQVEPFYCEPVVPGDRITLKNKISVHSNPMKSPFLSQIHCKKVNTYVPMQAILPFTWDYIYKNPSRGDDVVAEECNTVFADFPKFVRDFYRVVINLLSGVSTKQTGALPQAYKKALIAVTLFDNIASTGSLLSSLGYKLSFLIQNVRPSYSLDNIINDFWNILIPDNFRFSLTEYFDDSIYQVYYVVAPSSNFVTTSNKEIVLTKRGARDLILSHINDIDEEFSFAYTELNSPWKDIVWDDLPFFDSYLMSGPTSSNTASLNLNYSPLVAYQLSCAQFFVNPKVDYIFDAELWRQSLKYIITSSAYDLDSFFYNGMSVMYDFVSWHYMKNYVAKLRGATVNSTLFDLLPAFRYINSIFSYDRALRFGDYYTGARTQPYGVDVDDSMKSPVVGNNVSAIDVTKSIVFQRFFNMVAKVGNSVDDYRKALTGKVTPPDYHYPRFISADDTDVSSYTVQNNSNVDTGNLVSRVDSGELKKYEYTLDIDLHGYVLSMAYFYIPRAYSTTKRRWFFHVDRFDMFNEMLQNIGDQALYGLELSDYSPSIFAYQGRNEEYKQRTSMVTGAFCGSLKSWVFLNDPLGSPAQGTLRLPLNPNVIRSYPSELDYVFIDVQGLSNSFVYHFICHINNDVDFVRPMIKSPNIL
nr:MAG: major capsid protein [Microvirus sp.]